MESKRYSTRRAVNKAEIVDVGVSLKQQSGDESLFILAQDLARTEPMSVMTGYQGERWNVIWSIKLAKVSSFVVENFTSSIKFKSKLGS